jgi:hypothetical protein
MTHDQFVLRRVWFAVAPDGSERELVIGIEAPFEEPTGEWRAKLSAAVLGPPIAVAGLDSWQAVFLAMKFAATRLEHLAEKGWKFYWEKDGDAVGPGDLNA